MKKIISLLLAAMMVCLLACTALAEGAEYANAQAVTALFDAKNVKYTCMGLDSAGYEVIDVSNRGEAFSYTIHYFFTADNEAVSLRVWNIITYSDADLAKVLQAVNTVNAQFKYVKFYVDETDNTVTASIDVITREGAAVADCVWEATLHLVTILDEGYEIIGDYNQ